jgi:hypothetical protein
MQRIAASPAVDGDGVHLVTADPGTEPAPFTPGEHFAAALSRHRGGDMTVGLGIHLPAAFPLVASRPRYTVRHLMKTADVGAGGSASFVFEPAVGRLGSGTSYASTPEAAFAPRLADVRLTDLSVSVPLPDGILDKPSLLASFIDFRVLVRLSAHENESLLHGSPDGAIAGLLNIPGTRARQAGKDLEEAVVETAAEVEETGGSCDGIVAHPFVYWEMVRSGLLGRLAVAGITVSRTRMIPRDTLLLGDFRAATTLLLPGVASLALRRGAAADGTDLIEATTRVGLAVHLPQHFITLSWSGDNV